MKTHRKIAWILALIVTLIFFLTTFIRSPTSDIVRILVGCIRRCRYSGLPSYLCYWCFNC